jgi:hypothetical protein
MGRSKLLALIFVSGYIVAFAPVLWARLDVSRIPRSIWRYTAPHPRQLWRGGLLVAYLCGGWPGLVVAVGWRFSNDRRALREEWAHLHRRNEQPKRTASAPGPSSASSAPGAEPGSQTEEPEIVLADYESVDEPEPPAVSTHEDLPPRAG